MKSFKINAQGIGAAIGLLLVNGIVYLIFHRTPASEEEINAYIQNSEGRIQRANALHRKVIKSFRKNTQKEYKNLIFLLVED